MWKQLVSKSARQEQMALEMLEHIVYTPTSIGEPVDRLSGWEYLFLASELQRFIAAVAPTRAELDVPHGPPTGSIVGDPIGEIVHALESITTTVALTGTAFSPTHLLGAFGPPGVEANVAAVSHIAAELTGIYLNLIHLALDLRTTNFGTLAAVAKDCGDTCLGPIAQIETFAVTLAENVRAVADEVRAGKPQTTPLRVALTITMDEDVQRRLTTDIAALAPRRR